MPSVTRRNFLTHLPATVAAGAGAASALSLTAATPEAASAVPVPRDSVFNVRDFGAKGDGTTPDTAALQNTIDQCSSTGGGTVLFPSGRFLSGTLSLKDNVVLHLSAGAILLGSQNAKDYAAKPFPARDLDVGGFEVWALIHADGAKNIGIEGQGKIDGNGKPFVPRAKIQPLDVASGVRPRGIFLKDCTRVILRDFHLCNSGMWSLHLARSENVVVDGLTIFTEYFVQQDGIVIDSSRNVRVANCSVNTVDDAIIFKSSYPQRCEHVTITNCVLTCNSSAIKFGTQSLGGFRNIAISNCACHDCRLGGIKFEAIDGGTLEDVTVTNITMVNVSAALFFKLGNRARDYGFKEVAQPQPIGALRNIIVSGLRASMTLDEKLYQGGAISPADRRVEPMRVANTIIIGGLPDHPIENILLSDIHITCPGRGTAEEAERTQIPEEEKRYPENDMFGILPSWGFYVRHVKGLTLSNVRLDLSNPDLRTAFLADDVEDLELNGFRAQCTGGKHFIRLIRTRRARIERCRTSDAVGTFVQLENSGTSDIVLLGNDARLAAQGLVKAAGFEGDIQSISNLGKL